MSFSQSRLRAKDPMFSHLTSGKTPEFEPEGEHRASAMNDFQQLCRICGSKSDAFDRAVILGKHSIRYFRCTDCGFVQTETPYWLDEAYSSAIAAIDTGIMYRNLQNRRITASVVNLLYPNLNSALDYGAGHGIFVRMMRDAGFNFFWYDLHATNDYARGFEHKSGTVYDLVTSFEVLEHLVDPISEIETLMDLAPNVLVSTETLPAPPPKVSDWWYYATVGGQHVSFYSVKSLQTIAWKFKRSLLSWGPYHLFASIPQNRLLFRIAMHPRTSHFCARLRRRPSLMIPDLEVMSKQAAGLEDSEDPVEPKSGTADIKPRSNRL